MIHINDLPDVFTLLAANIKADGVLFAVKAMVENGNKKYRDEFLKVDEVVSNGGTLSVGLEKADLFDAKTIAVIRANEEAGKLESAFKELARIAKFQRHSRRQIKKSLGMPLVSLVVLVGVVMFLAEGVFTQLALRDKSGDTFLLTMKAMGTVIGENQWLYPFVLIIVSFLLIKLVNSRTVAKSVSTLAMKLPVFGELLKTSQIGIWCRFAALMTNSGIPIVQTKDALKSVLSERYSLAVDAMFNDVSNGKDWSAATSSSQWDNDDPRTELPSLYLSYMNAAGVSGIWDDKMNDAAETFLEEYENAVESTKPVIDAVSIILVALPLAYIVAQLFSNIYGGNNAI